MLSCCKTTEKKTEIAPDVGDNVVTEIIPTDSVRVGPKNNVQDRINAIYRDMIRDTKQITSYDASYKVRDVSSKPHTFLDFLSDDGKYFYSIGNSKLCSGRKDASHFAVEDAVQNLKKAAVKISADENIDVRGYKVFERCFKEVITDKGRTYYTATVLIGIDRNLVVKN